MLIFRQTSEIVSPLARSRSISRSTRATSSAVRRFFMGPSLANSTEGLPFQVDQFLGSRPNRLRVRARIKSSTCLTARRDCVVPFAVELGGLDLEFRHLLVRDRDSSLILAVIERGFHDQ